MFSITIDTEWVPQVMLDDVAEILNNYGVKATFFVTNVYDFSKLKGHELAIHPNFEKNSNLNEILQKTISYLPSKTTKGTRSHKKYQTSDLITAYHNFGIEYDSNHFLPNYEKPLPFFHDHSSILEIPFIFMDYQFSTFPNFDLDKINLNDSGVKVFDFHPSHVYMNTHSLDEYEKIKQNYHDVDYLNSVKNYEKPGNRNVFFKILDFIEKNNIEHKTMIEINDLFRSNSI